MSNHKAHFRGDIQVDGSIVGPDGQPVGGGSVDLTHLTELAFGEASVAELRLLTEAEAEGFYVAPGAGLYFNSTLVIDDPDWNGIVVVNSDAWPVGGDYEKAAAEIWTAGDGGNFVAWAPDSFHPGFYQRAAVGSGYGFTRASGLPTDQLLRAYIPNESNPRFYMDIAGKLAWGPGGEDALDVTLERDGTSNIWSSADLRIGGDDPALIFGLDADWTDKGSYIASTDLYMQRAGGTEYIDITPNGWSVHYAGGMTQIDARSNSPQFWMSDVYATLNWGTRQQHFYYYNDDPTHQFLDFQIDGEGSPRFKLDQNGRLQWGPGSTGQDTHLKRRSAGVLELEENGGGLVLHSPDGTAYKISVANGGALSAVAA